MDFSAASPRPPLHSANSSLQTPKSGLKPQAGIEPFGARFWFMTEKPAN
jgi:hypothetical protein